MIRSRVAAAALFALSVGAAQACVDPKNCPTANVEIPAPAETAFQNGDYLLAATTAEAKNTTPALAFAARARIADAITRSDNCLDCLIKAEATAEAAIKAASPTEEKQALAQAYVQLAIAIGFHGRLLGTLEAQSEGLAEKGRAAVDRALELDGTNAWARASLGGWHLEIVHRAGSLLASALYDADEDEGLRNFRAALAADPGNLLLRYHYALSILALDLDRFRNEAITTLREGYKDPRDDAMTKFTRKRTDALLDALTNRDEKTIKLMVAYYQGYRLVRKS